MRLYTHYVTDLVKKLLYSSLHPFFHFTVMSCHVLSLSLSLFISVSQLILAFLCLYLRITVSVLKKFHSLIHYLSRVFYLILPSLYFSHYCPTTSWKTLLVSSKTTFVVRSRKIRTSWVPDEDFSSIATLQSGNKEKILWVERTDYRFFKYGSICCLKS
jgi:hypothetical protein